MSFFSKIRTDVLKFVVCCSCVLCNIILGFFFPKLSKMSQNLSSAAVVIGALRVNDGIVLFDLLEIRS